MVARRWVLALLAAGAIMVGCGDDDGTMMPLADGGEDRTDGGSPADGGGSPDGGSPDGGSPDGGGTCVDEDGDGYGAGCSLGPDCDDGNGAVNPGRTETCNGVDDDCDGDTDEDVSAPACALMMGVCAGATQRCGASGFLACDATDYGATYQVDESLCDGLDNDCDGSVDEGCDCVDGTTQPCGSDLGVCSLGTQTCTEGAWGACEGAVMPSAELCNGLDDDCDGDTDEGDDLAASAPACPLQDGVCSGSRSPTCGGMDGWVECSATDYGSDYQADETLCDGLDNDCDGVTDPGCECIDGTSKACSTAAMCAGTQTCVGGTWGDCVPATTAEICNGLDDDCNGTIDDGLSAPACALTEGVCADAVQTCGGSAGWLACTADDYGATYFPDEAGDTDESACDGLDNDCDGRADEGCTSIPILAAPADEISPDLFHRHLVYLTNLDGNWDVVFADFNTGELRRLTATAEDETSPRVYGNHVVYGRGTGADARVVLYDLRTNTERVLSSAASGGATIYAGFVLWHEVVDDAQYELFFHEIASDTTQPLFDLPDSNEYSPSMRGSVVAFISDLSGTPLTYVIDFADSSPTAIAQTPAATSVHGQAAPVVDYTTVGWIDGRAITTAEAPVTADWDIFGAPFQSSGSYAAFPGENPVATASGPQILRDIESGFFVWTDATAGNWNPVIGWVGGPLVTLSSHPSEQFDPTMSGDFVMWVDRRLGNYDLYGAVVAIADPPTPRELVINELLADPAAGADVNGDGVANTSQDEFVEIYNVTGNAIDLSDATLSDSTRVRHRFPPGTVVPALGAIVVFGGGELGTTSVFGGAHVQIASSGALDLDDGGDILVLRFGSTVIDSVTYGSIASSDQSIVRGSALDDTAPFVLHTSVTPGVAYSPGTDTDGFAF